MSVGNAVIVWFRQDLRLEDNPALYQALSTQLPIIPVYFWCPQEAGEWSHGAASKIWLNASLSALKADLKSKGSDLVLRQAPTAETLLEIAQSTGAKQVHCNARYEPWAIAQQEKAQQLLTKHGIQLLIHKGATLLWEPDTIQTRQGQPYQVFTPFLKRCLTQLPEIKPLPAPDKMPAPAIWPQSHLLEQMALLPEIAWDSEIRSTWRPGAFSALSRLQHFLANVLTTYDQTRNMLNQTGTSQLSPHLAHGEISPRQIWKAVEDYVDSEPDFGTSGNSGPSLKKAVSTFLQELVWREFAYHALYHFPNTPTQPLKAKFEHLPWQTNPDWLKAWRQGKTGYPIVDAGMRQLWRIGWMHNRARMIVGSFLTKDLLIPWQEGAHWFWDTLVDADLAVNTLNWQWVAGCGADAQPFFRIFNPATQSEKFDPNGDYIRRWVPELDALSIKQIHNPGQMNASSSSNRSESRPIYPAPVVVHAEAREKALRLYKAIGSSSSV